MKALLLHANRYEARVESQSQRLGDTEPDELEPQVEDDFGVGVRDGALVIEHMEECLVVLFQVEQGDGDKAVKRICKDAKKIADIVGTRRIMLGAFGHLSDKWPENPEISKEIARQVVEICKGFVGYQVQSSHFGYNKTLLLDIKGHQNAIKHRSY
jgi:hypothetical protein